MENQMLKSVLIEITNPRVSEKTRIPMNVALTPTAMDTDGYYVNYNQMSHHIKFEDIRRLPLKQRIFG